MKIQDTVLFRTAIKKGNFWCNVVQNIITFKCQKDRGFRS